MTAPDPVQAVAEVVQSRAISIEDAWAVLAAARPAIEREVRAERDALAARLAAVEALADRMAKIHNRLHGDVEINHHEHLRSARDHVRTLHDDLRAALEADQ